MRKFLFSLLSLLAIGGGAAWAEGPDVAGKSFTLSCGRGNVSGNGTSLSGGNSATLSKFAIVTYEDETFLYDVDNKVFVIHSDTEVNGNNNGCRESANDFSMIIKGLTWKAGNDSEHWILADEHNYYLNMSGTAVRMNTWRTADDGNQYIVTVAEDFDDTEAIQLLEKYLPDATITYILQDTEGNTILQTDIPAKSGTIITETPSRLTRAFCTYEVPQTTIVKGSQTINITVTYNLPFKTDGTTYYTTLRNHYIYYDTTNDYVCTNQSSKENTAAYMWQFSGTPYTGIKIKNVAANKYLNYVASEDYVQLAEEADAYAWNISQLQESTTFGFNNGTNYINEENHSNHRLIYWWQFDGDKGSYWAVEEAVLPVEISDTEWATFSAPIATTIPKGVTAYIATGVNDGKLVIEPINGDVIPANTGVLLNAAADTYNFASTADANNIENNIFVGTTEETTVDELSVYVLANKEDKGLGFYLLNDTRVPANKAYIPVNSVSKAANFLGFGDSDITAIESAEAAADAAAQSAIHYDLQGRRVAAPQKGQLYIVNGKKVLY